MVISADKGWKLWAGGDVLEFYLFIISFRKWNKKMQEGIRNFKGHNFIAVVKFDGDD